MCVCVCVCVCVYIFCMSLCIYMCERDELPELPYIHRRQWMEL